MAYPPPSLGCEGLAEKMVFSGFRLQNFPVFIYQGGLAGYTEKMAMVFLFIFLRAREF